MIRVINFSKNINSFRKELDKNTVAYEKKNDKVYQKIQRMVLDICINIQGANSIAVHVSPYKDFVIGRFKYFGYDAEFKFPITDLSDSSKIEMELMHFNPTVYKWQKLRIMDFSIDKVEGVYKKLRAKMDKIIQGIAND